MHKITSRETLTPPPVDPAQAPTIISSTRIHRLSWGHRSKSVVLKPVVVMTDETAKKAWWNASNAVGNIPRMLRVIISVLPAMMAKYARTSVFRHAMAYFFISRKK